MLFSLAADKNMQNKFVLWKFGCIAALLLCVCGSKTTGIHLKGEKNEKEKHSHMQTHCSSTEDSQNLSLSL